MPENTIWGTIVRIWQGVIRVGNRTATPTPASGALVAGTVTIESAGNSTNGKLEMEATTSGGTVRKLTIQPSQAMTGSHTLTGLTALPGSTQMLTVTSAGQLGTSTLPTGTVGGTGTDMHIARFDGTGDIQDTGWEIDDSDYMTTTTGRIEVTGSIASNLIAASNSNTTGGAAAITGEHTAATGAVLGVLGTTASSNNAAYGGKFNRTDLGTWADVTEQASDPATPPSGKGRYYGKTDGKAYYINDAGTVYDLTASGGSSALSIHTVSDADYSASTSDDVILYTSLSATRTVSLPAASSYGSGAVVIVKDGSGSAAFATNITVDPNGGETIDGAGTKKILSAYGALTLLSDGSNWHIV